MRSTETEVMETGLKSPCRCWDWNLGPLPAEYLTLTTELFLAHTYIIVLYTFSYSIIS